LAIFNIIVRLIDDGKNTYFIVAKISGSENKKTVFALTHLPEAGTSKTGFGRNNILSACLLLSVWI
jgi:hypothetical protein